jgi:single-stranded DNA-binding protein
MSREHISTATLVGRLGQKPELGETTDGVKYARLNIATNDRYTDRGGSIRETTQWTRAIVWGDKAEEVAAQFDKGNTVSLIGALRVNSYEKDGAKNRVLELHVDHAAPAAEPNISMNDAQLLGVVRSVEAKDVGEGKSLTVVSLGTTTTQNGKQREDWHNVTMWGKTGELAAKEISVGDTVSINGSVRHKSIEGPGGAERRLSGVDCRQFQVLERAQEREKAAPARDKSQDRGQEAPASPPRSRSRQRGKSVDRGM